MIIVTTSFIVYDFTHTFYYYSLYRPINRFLRFPTLFFYSFEVRQYSINYVIITSSSTTIIIIKIIMYKL